MKQPTRDTSLRLRTEVTVRTKLASIAQIARNNKDVQFCALAHLMNKNTLKEAFRRISNSASPGVDKVTKDEYAKDLDRNIADLHEKLKKGSYRPMPVKRKYIPKTGSKKLRPLGMPAIEDKIVQGTLVIILESIYEEDFLDLSFGFRKGKSQHDALKNLSKDIGIKKVEYIVDADIHGFFDHVEHHWMMEFLKLRISDRKILSLLKRFLKAGIMENGEYIKTEEGVPQGGSLSPLLANIYLHYVLDIWFTKVVTKHCKGEAYITRYADDSVACFQYKEDAQKYYEALIKRLAKFSLEIAEEKTRIIEFGRFAERDAKKKGERKPETFDFLGFTHYCGRSRKGRFKLKWKTSRKKFIAKVKEFNKWMKENRRSPLSIIWNSINQKLRGHYNYYGVSDNWNNLLRFKREIIKITYQWLKRRSQRSKLNWEKFNNMMKNYPLINPKSLINLNSAFV